MGIANGAKVKVDGINDVEWILICERVGSETTRLVATECKSFGWATNMLNSYELKMIKKLGLNENDYSFYYVDCNDLKVICYTIDANSLTIMNDDGKHSLHINELGVAVNTKGFDLHKVVGLLGKLNEKELDQVKLEIEKVETERTNESISNHVKELNKLLLPLSQYIEKLIEAHPTQIEDIEWFTCQTFKLKGDSLDDYKYIDFE